MLEHLFRGAGPDTSAACSDFKCESPTALCLGAPVAAGYIFAHGLMAYLLVDEKKGSEGSEPVEARLIPCC